MGKGISNPISSVFAFELAKPAGEEEVTAQSPKEGKAQE